MSLRFLVSNTAAAVVAAIVCCCDYWLVLVAVNVCFDCRLLCLVSVEGGTAVVVVVVVVVATMAVITIIAVDSSYNLVPRRDIRSTLRLLLVAVTVVVVWLWLWLPPLATSAIGFSDYHH